MSNRRSAATTLLLILVGFVAFRLPFLLKLPASYDEALLAVPGLTLLREGVPRIPYQSSEQPTSYYWRADEVLMFYPPGGFCVQAMLYAILPPGLPTARLANFLAALAAIWMTFELGRRAYGVRAGLWAAGLYAVSRVLFFVSVTSRLDALCSAFGLGAILILWNDGGASSFRRLAAAGLCLGLGLFTHPFAMVYCLLCGVWVLCARQPLWRRFAAGGVLTGATLLVLSLWLPLIVAHYEIFRVQFSLNILDPVQSSFFRRLLWPWPYAAYQMSRVQSLTGPWQIGAMGAGLCGASVLAIRSGSAAARRLVALAWGAVYLMVACLGVHATKLYWCFPGALVLIATGGFLAEAIERLRGSGLRRSTGWSLALLAPLLFAPQSGVRTWWNLVTTREDPRYDARLFTRKLIDSLPRGDRFIVGERFAYDFWLEGLDVTLLEERETNASRADEYDWLVLGRRGIRSANAAKLQGRFVRAVGIPHEIGCYAEVYRPAQ